MIGNLLTQTILLYKVRRLRWGEHTGRVGKKGKCLREGMEEWIGKQFGGGGGNRETGSSGLVGCTVCSYSIDLERTVQHPSSKPVT